jgi:hypothetical protein
MSFESELRRILNKYSQENPSNTPDYILAQYMIDCLGAFNAATKHREEYFGRFADLEDTQDAH